MGRVWGSGWEVMRDMETDERGIWREKRRRAFGKRFPRRGV